MLNLIKHLPPNSATVVAKAGPAAAWTVDQHLLASAVDLLAAGNWQRGGNPRAPRPKPIPRPGAKPRHQLRKPKPKSMAEIDRIMAGWSEPRPGRAEKAIVFQ